MLHAELCALHVLEQHDTECLPVVAMWHEYRCCSDAVSVPSSAEQACQTDDLETLISWLRL